MISYRSHLVSLVAVFLALAIGVVLGGGPLSEVGRSPAPASDTAAARTAGDNRAEAFGNKFASAGASALYDGQLADQSVALLVMPGASGDSVTALAGQVEAAGAQVAGRYDVEPGMVAAGEKQLVDTLGGQLLEQLKGDTVPADAPTYDRLGQLLAVALGSTEARDRDVVAVQQSLVAAELLGVPDQPSPAGLVVVVLGDDLDDAVLAGLVTGLAAQVPGVVVAGDAASGVSGDLRALRREPVADDVTTVDGVDTPLGQVTAVLALIRTLSISGGSFGPSGGDGAVPLG